MISGDLSRWKIADWLFLVRLLSDVGVFLSIQFDIAHRRSSSISIDQSWFAYRCSIKIEWFADRWFAFRVFHFDFWLWNTAPISFSPKNWSTIVWFNRFEWKTVRTKSFSFRSNRRESFSIFVAELLKTIDFFVPGELRPILQIDKEREVKRLIVQLGTCDGERALKAARIVENDVAGIDINMGCPKKFSLQGGMGAALLDHPEKIKQVQTRDVDEKKKIKLNRIKLLFFFRRFSKLWRKTWRFRFPAKFDVCRV